MLLVNVSRYCATSYLVHRKKKNLLQNFVSSGLQCNSSVAPSVDYAIDITAVGQKEFLIIS